MSLSAFHAVFISLAAMGAFAFAGYCAQAVRTGTSGPWARLAIVSGIAGLALVGYARWASKRHARLLS